MVALHLTDPLADQQDHREADMHPLVRVQALVPERMQALVQVPVLMQEPVLALTLVLELMLVLEPT